MAFRFQKRFKILPGVRVNISKTGISGSLGRPGATVNIGKKGVKATAGIPGTGLSHQTRLDGASPKGAAPAYVNPSPKKRSRRGVWFLFGIGLAGVLVWLTR